MINRSYAHSELTAGVIGCAMAVHAELGSGFQEVVYQRALAVEMLDRGISFGRQEEMPIFYKRRQVGTRRVDFLVEGVVAVELKALGELEDIHLAQAINYLEAYNLDVGLLINFGGKSLEFKRLSNPRRRARNIGGRGGQSHPIIPITEITVQTTPSFAS